MKRHFTGEALLYFLGILLFAPPVHAAALSPALLKAKQDAEARGFSFVADREEIVAKAQKEGRLRVITSMEPETAKSSVAAFKTRYPFIDLSVQVRTGSESAQQLILQIKSGVAAKEWDVVSTTSDLLNDYIPHLWKVDLQGMAERGVLQIPHQMVDSTQRNIVAFHSRFQVMAYNKNLVAPALVPKVWEDLLKPEFKKRKFSLDIRPGGIATLIPAWGLDRTDSGVCSKIGKSGSHLGTRRSQGDHRDASWRNSDDGCSQFSRPEARPEKGPARRSPLFYCRARSF